LSLEKQPQEIGKVTHFFTKISVAVVELKAPLSVGDIEQDVESMQIEHENVKTAKAGQSIGLKVKDHVRETDTVYKLV